MGEEPVLQVHVQDALTPRSEVLGCHKKQRGRLVKFRIDAHFIQEEGKEEEEGEEEEEEEGCLMGRKEVERVRSNAAASYTYSVFSD